MIRRFFFASCIVVSTALAAPPAFPGAEGFGAGAVGGRGGEVYEVTNLNDAGPGSLRDAVSQPNRTVVFRVSGTIDLNSQIRIQQPNITIAGQTAPGDGICLRNHELMIANTHNVIVRFLRIRPGSAAGKEMDALSIRNSRDVIVDHCSLSWSTDSINDVTHLSGNVTVQWCIMSEPLKQSVHSKGSHGYGTGWDGRGAGGASFHHNLIAHCDSRAPRIGYNKTGRGLIDCRNNVIYNTGNGSAYGGEGDDFNFVANYFVPGPDTKRPEVLFEFWGDDTKAHVSGNMIDGRDDITADNRKGLVFKKGTDAMLSEKPIEMAAPLKTDDAKTAYQRVLQSAGAVLPKRDKVDARIISDVKKGTGKIINSPEEVGGWPELKSAEAPKDSDRDGMPDEWETARKLNPNDASDGARVDDKSGYTNLEMYLNELAEKIGA